MKYKSLLNVHETQVAIGEIKHLFPQYLARALNLRRVTAPLFLDKSTGLNDGLNGETPAKINFKDDDAEIEIIHSLAKWKRFSLKYLNFPMGEGLYADMNAIRREEVLDATHSYYVDQWDWEKSIPLEARTMRYLKHVTNDIYNQIKRLEYRLKSDYPQLSIKLPEELVFIDSQDLEDMYPDLTPEERETAFAKEHAKAFFVLRIGHKLKSQQPHAGRAFDYDDWNLNGDLIFYHPPLDKAMEISSMGIRVTRQEMIIQSGKSEEEVKKISPFHRSICENHMPISIGGGIGQSRLCMFLLEKAHVGEVQSSYWNKKERSRAKEEGIILL